MQAADYRDHLHAHIVQEHEYAQPTLRAQVQAILHDVNLETLIHLANVPEMPVYALRAFYEAPDMLLDRLASFTGLEWLVDDDGGLHFVERPDELLWTIEAMQAGTATGKLKYRAGQPLVQVLGIVIDVPYSFKSATVTGRYAVRLRSLPVWDAPIFQVEDYELEPA